MTDEERKSYYRDRIAGAEESISAKNKEIDNLESKIESQEDARDKFTSMWSDFEEQRNNKKNGMPQLTQYQENIKLAKKYADEMGDILEGKGASNYEQDMNDTVEAMQDEINKNYEKIDDLNREISELEEDIREWEKYT